MTKRTTAAQRRKHLLMAKELHAKRLSLSGIERAESAPLEAYQILQEALVALKKRRLERRMTLDRLAAVSGIDKAYLSRLENGKVFNPTFETLYRYASAIRPIRALKDLLPT